MMRTMFRNLVKISRIRYKFLFLFPIHVYCVGHSQEITFPGWKHFSIDAILPGSSWGTGGPALADYDGDGDLDVAISRRNTKSAYWYERKNDSVWIQHLMGLAETLASTLGTTPVDIDQDGWIDVVFEGVWFRNPGNLATNPDALWYVNYIKAGGHDATTADIDSDGKNDLLIYDGKKIAWYNTSNKLSEVVISSGYNDHGGVAPKGFGDIDGDQDTDVVIPGYWFANPGDQTGNWVRREWPYELVPNASYGSSIRAWITDIDNDGKMDIVYGNCDTGESHVYWVRNMNNGTDWESIRLPDPPTRPGDPAGTGSYHSLGVTDFNQDGTLDIFAGEQEDPSLMYGNLKPMKPKGLKERGVIWYNDGKKKPGFSVFIIHVDNPGWHDAQLGDVDGDGDIDIVSKVWNADGPVYHADYWRNELIKKPE